MSQAEFDRLLAAYAEAPSNEKAAAEAELWERFGRRCAVFISDLSGFTRLTAAHSIAHFLALIREARLLIEPKITARDGRVIKHVGDNVFATFPDVDAAIEASLAMQRALEARNSGRAEPEQLGLCIGIGFGDTLVIDGYDFFGDELNLAAKLGEDVALPGETLVTSQAMQASRARYAAAARSTTVSRVEIPHYCLTP